MHPIAGVRNGSKRLSHAVHARHRRRARQSEWREGGNQHHQQQETGNRAMNHLANAKHPHHAFS
jgi:hypothetical protein